MLIKEVINRRDELKNYLHSLSVATNYCRIQIGDKQLVEHLESLYAEVESEFNDISTRLNPFENMNM